MKFLVVLATILLFGRAHCQNTIGEELENLGLTTLLELLTDTDLLGTLEGLPAVTLFAPTNEAIADAGDIDPDALVPILTFHAIDSAVDSSAITNELLVASVNGADIRFNIYDDATLYTAQGAPIDLENVDIAVVNGFIHVVDRVMLPPTETIYELISNNPDFSTLLFAVDTAELGDLLNSPGNITAFAPDNAAFDRVPEDDLNNLLNDTEALTDVLLYHAAGATVFAASLNDGELIEMAQDDFIQIVFGDMGGVFINATDYAEIVVIDIPVTNGVVHVIDRVLKAPVIPPPPPPRFGKKLH